MATETTQEEGKRISRKMFFSMGEVAEMFDVNPSLIRFWEKRFDILKPKKNAKGNRLFTPADIENLKLIHHLVREKGMTLAGAEKYLKDNKNTIQRDVQLLERLQHIRAILMEIKVELGAESSDTEIIIQTDSESEASEASEAAAFEALAETIGNDLFIAISEQAEAELPAKAEGVMKEPSSSDFVPANDSKSRYFEPTLFDL